MLDVVTRWPAVHKISFVAHSLSGLVAWYAVGRLYQHHDAKVAGLELMNFITFATPHLGSWGNKQVSLTVLAYAFEIEFSIAVLFLHIFFYNPRFSVSKMLKNCL